MLERHLEKYRLEEEVGHGGMAVVYKGLDTVLNREVAIKILHSHLAEDEESKQRFHREAHAVAKLRHENIIEIYDYSGIDSDDIYIVTEFIHGQTLRDFLTRHPISHPEIAVMIIVEVCKALDHAHSLGVIHRDIKPENIMIRDDGVIKLTDFGIAQVVDVQRLTVTGQLLGSPAYMAPELVEGKCIDVRTDVFSVGTLLYQLATSELPFQGQNPHELLKRISDGRYIDPEVANPVVGSKLARIIHKALAHDPEDRYGTAQELQRDLIEFLEDVEIKDIKKSLTQYFASPVDFSKELQQQIVATLTQRGKEGLEQRKTPQALAFFNRVLCVDPSNEEVLQILGRIGRRRRISRVVAALLSLVVLAVGGYFLALYWPEAAPAIHLAQDSGLAPDGSGLPDLRVDARPPDAEVDRSAKASVRLDARGRQPKPTVRLLLPLRKVEIIPTPQNVSIEVNGKSLGNWGPDLRFIHVLPGRKISIIFRNPLCFDKVVPLGAQWKKKVLRVKLDWKPARVKVLVSPAVPANVLIGELVGRAGQPMEVKIPSYSKDGQAEVEIKVQAGGEYRTESIKTRVRANQPKTVHVLLARQQ